MAQFSAIDIADALGRPHPTPEQLEIIEAPLESMLVVAGAGSGKTETMAARVIWLVANGYVEPQDVLGLTFTRKAAAELATRITSRLRALREAGIWAAETSSSGEAAADQLLDDGAVTVSTYHAYAGRLVEEHGVRIGVEPDARLLTEAAAWQLAHDVVVSYDGPMAEVTHAESTVTRAVVALSGELAEHLRGVADLEEHHHALRDRIRELPRGEGRFRTMPKQVNELLQVVSGQLCLAPILAEYARVKRSTDCLDFADQVACAARLARDFPDIARQERARYRLVLLDEFQDTSEAQMVMLRALFADVGAGEPVPVVAVGDPHQSIYGWRGASATTLARFPRLFADGRSAGEGEAATAVRHLSVSWRNSGRVLAVANRCAAPLHEGSPVPVRRLATAPEAPPGAVEVARLETAEQEAAYVAQRLAEVWFTSEGAARGISAAVLCRRRAQFVPLVEALHARGLPVEVVGLGGLLTMPEVTDVVALLSVVADPARGDRLMRLLTGPFCRLGAADLDAFAAWALRSGAEVVRSGEAFLERPGLVESLEELPPPGWSGPQGQTLSSRARRRLGVLSEVVLRLRAMTGAALADLVIEAERALGVDVELLARPELPAEGARAHLDAFADAAAAFQASAERPTLSAFLSWLDVAMQEERGLEVPAQVASRDAVQILTVHAAKGLEWDVVAVPGLVEGAFPNSTGGTSTFGEEGWTVPPARDKGWCVGLDRVPYALRGDVDGLPSLRWESASDLTSLARELDSFFLDGGERAVSEERRLAYVAFTRARELALLTAPVWTEATSPRVTSRFLAELVEDPDLLGVLREGPWAPMPGRDAKETRPRPERADSMSWPGDPMAARRSLVLAGAAVLMRERAAMPQQRADRYEQDLEQGARDGSVADAEVLAVLREHRSWRGGVSAEDVRVELPRHLSTSSMVLLAQDEEAFASRLRRPMPAPPALRARSGTAFHSWVEAHFRKATLFDMDDLLGEGEIDEVIDLGEAKEHFLASRWAGQDPVAVELAVETPLGGLAIRGRIDAVFREGEGFVVVDWKSGRPPVGRRARAVAVQLGIYRVAFARLRGIPLSAVRGAFYYAATGETVFPRLPDVAELDEIIGAIAR